MLPMPARMTTAMIFTSMVSAMLTCSTSTEPTRPPARPARAHPMAQTKAEMRSVLMPIKAAPSWSWAMAKHGLADPGFLDEQHHGGASSAQAIKNTMNRSAPIT
jgi:hypothetical protein